MRSSLQHVFSATLLSLSVTSTTPLVHAEPSTIDALQGFARERVALLAEKPTIAILDQNLWIAETVFLWKEQNEQEVKNADVLQEELIKMMKRPIDIILLRELFWEYTSSQKQEEKKEIAKQIFDVLKWFKDDEDILFSAGSIFVQEQNYITGFYLMRASLSISDKHKSELVPLFENIIEIITQKGIEDNSIQFAIQTFGPFIRDDMTKKLQKTHLSETQRKNLQDALRLIKIAK